MNERATIAFEPSGRTVSVPVGSTLLEAARAAGVEIDAPCGGAGACGSCRVKVRDGVSPMSSEERELLGAAGVRGGKRLACRTRVTGDTTVTVPGRPREARIVTAVAWRPVEIEAPEARGIEGIGTLVGAVVDIGTTTVAVHIVDLRTGETLAGTGDLNAQRVFGADVLSRVAYSAGGIESRLQTMVVGQVEDLLADALGQAGLAVEALEECLVVGNVAMTGLFLGRDVSALGEAPYEGAPLAGETVAAHEIGFTRFPSLDITVPPAASAFIGSDVTAGLLAASIADRAAPTLFIDLGTNGEIVLAARGRLLAASAAAGPALEGASIECGMRAEAGAIEAVESRGSELVLSVIGDRTPSGICGSGLVDLIAVLLDAGMIDASGRLLDAVGHPLRSRLTEHGGVRAFVVDQARAIVLTQRDIRQVQLAVGAVRTGIGLLLAEASLDPQAVVAVAVAGGFGYHLRSASLVRIGLLPPQWMDRVVFEGNTALAGGRAMLLNSVARRRAETIAARIETVDLAAHPGFQKRFIAALDFPG